MIVNYALLGVLMLIDGLGKGLPEEIAATVIDLAGKRLDRVYGAQGIIAYTVCSLMYLADNAVFLERTVHEIIFGYTDELLSRFVNGIIEDIKYVQPPRVSQADQF